MDRENTISDITGKRDSIFHQREVTELIEKIETKIREKAIKKDMPAAPYLKILLTFANKDDKILLLFGFISASLCGFGLPSFVFLFGDIADSFLDLDPTKILSAITFTSRTLALIGLAVGACSYMFFTFFIIASERIGMKTRVAYLESILK